MQQPPYPATLADIYFPSQDLGIGNFSSVLSSIRRSALSIPNRLLSITDDANFVQHVSRHYNHLPLVANERCGSWYIPPDCKAGSAYFKSTDGHTGQWDFSLRRLNLQLFDVLAQHGRCMIVDSTRRGKAWPDALSKTVPIWCAVMNRVLFPTAHAYHAVQVLPHYLSPSEQSQIEGKIDSFVRSFLNLRLDLDALRRKAHGKPIRLLWVTRDTPLPRPPSDEDEKNYNLVVLCSASRRILGAEVSEHGYIQGAGDDAEAWARGLTPAVFWKHAPELLEYEPGCNEGELMAVIERVVDEGQRQVSDVPLPVRILPTQNLYIGKRPPAGAPHPFPEFDVVIDCIAEPAVDAGLTPALAPDDVAAATVSPLPPPQRPNQLNLGLQPGKLGARNLRKILPTVIDFVASHLSSSTPPAGDPKSILVLDDSGKDLAVGVALAVICLFYDDQGGYCRAPGAAAARKMRAIDKEFIRQRLAWIVSSKSDANPARATLQSVNSFLMERPE